MTTDIKTTNFVFSHIKLTEIEDKPTNATITILKQEVYANAIGNECTLGCGNFGYLGLIMPEADYRAKQIAIAPDDIFSPFNKPIVDPTADDATQKEDERKLRDYKAMDIVLKQQILSAIDTSYITRLKDAEVGYAAVTAKQILQHLITKYGTITFEDLAKNTEVLNEPWNSEKPICTLWDRIMECQRIAIAGGVTIDDKVAMYTALNLLKDTGLFSSYILNWRQANPIQAAWTMAAFQEYFDRADEDRKQNITTKDAGFHGANAAVTTTKNETKKDTAKQEGATRTTTNFVDPDTGKKIYYCWSHGTVEDTTQDIRVQNVNLQRMVTKR